MMDDDQHEAFGAMIHRGKVEQGAKEMPKEAKFSVTKLTEALRFVKRPVVDCGDIKERVILQQATVDLLSGEITWIDVPTCDEQTGIQI